MITAVDTSVLLDVFGADPTFGPRSAAALRTCLREGRLVACDVVWAETSSVFPSVPEADALLARLGVEYDPVALPTASIAGGAWRRYRARGGKRTRLVADFLIGAHAAEQADRLLTRDRGFYRSYYTGLEIVDPARS